jgi:RNA 2',3'-cyclic 3'-phosphodiesterase
MRLFVALSPPAAALAELDQAAAPLRASWPELRWVGVDLWHVTLAFLGEVDDGKLDELERRLERAAARHAGQPLAIGRGDAFSSVKRARVLIARIEAAGAGGAGGRPPARHGEGETSALHGLAASVAAGARRAGAPPPDEGGAGQAGRSPGTPRRKYEPHLTLARTREPADLSGPVTALEGFSGQPWTPVQIHLVHSVLRPTVRYETVRSWPLGAS